MLMYLTNDVPSNAFKHDNQTLHEQYHAIQVECRVLQQHYQTLYDHFHTLLQRSPIMQRHDLDRTAYRNLLHDYCQSLQQQQQRMQHFRHTLHVHLIRTRSFRSFLNSGMPAERPIIRTTILLAMGNAQDVAVLKESLQQADAHRVFVATTRNEVLCLVKNVHLDQLIFDDELFPLPGSELYYLLQGMKRLETLPAPMMYDCFSPFQQAGQRIHLFESTGTPPHGRGTAEDSCSPLEQAERLHMMSP